MINDEWAYINPEAEPHSLANINDQQMQDEFNADLMLEAIKKYAPPHHSCLRCPGCNEIENKTTLNTNIYGLCYHCNIDRLNHTNTYYMLKGE